MKQSDIKVGKMYCNRGKGMTIRRVIDINKQLGHNLNDVKYMAMDVTGNQLMTYSDSCPLSSFAKWAGREVKYES